MPVREKITLQSRKQREPSPQDWAGQGKLFVMWQIAQPVPAAALKGHLSHPHIPSAGQLPTPTPYGGETVEIWNGGL